MVVGGLISKSWHTLVTPWTVACQAPLSMGFPRQEYCSGLPFPSPGDCPNLGIETTFSAFQVDSLPLSHQGFWHLSNLLLSRTHHSSITSAPLGVVMWFLDVFKFPNDSNMDPISRTIQGFFFFFLHVIET